MSEDDAASAAAIFLWDSSSFEVSVGGAGGAPDPLLPLELDMLGGGRRVRKAKPKK